MRIFFDIITILGFILTVLGTYLTIRSGDGEIIIKDEFLVSEKGGESLSKYHALCKDDQSFKKMISIIKTHVLCKRGRNINQIIDEIEMLNKDS